MRKITLNDITITRALTNEEVEAAKVLFIEYADNLSVDLEFQGFDEELDNIREQYLESGGSIFLAKTSQGICGCAAIRPFAIGICELKRMYIRKAYRRVGLGQKLLDRALDAATESGYKKIRLDTLPDMQSAISLYIRNGFHEIEAYRFNPIEGTKYLEKNL